MRAMAAAGVFLMISVTSAVAAEIQLGRYSVKEAAAEPAQRDLLAVIVETQLPRQVLTVGDALRFLLRRSGYRLGTPSPTDTDMANLLALPLPAVHRHLGPISLRDALAAIAGPAYELHTEPVRRQLHFAVRDTYRDAAQCGLPPAAPTTAPDAGVPDLDDPRETPPAMPHDGENRTESLMPEALEYPYHEWAAPSRFTRARQSFPVQVARHGSPSIAPRRLTP